MFKIDEIDFNNVNQVFRDAGTSAFFLRELEYVKTKTYDTKQKVLKAMSLLPISTEADPAAEKITFQRYTQIALAKIITDYADDVPRADVYGREESVNVYRIGSSYGYSRDEVRRSMMANKRLEQRRANAARRATEEKIDRIAWNGDEAHNINGFIDYPGITEYTVPDGVSASPLWSTKTPDEIITDMSGIVTGVIDSTNGVEVPAVMLMPIAQYELISNTRMTDGDSKTIMRYFLDNNPHIKTIDWLTELKGAGEGGTDRFMVYPNNPDALTLEIPLPYTPLPPEVKGYGFQVLTEAKTAGVIIYYPLAVAFGDGI